MFAFGSRKRALSGVRPGAGRLVGATFLFFFLFSNAAAATFSLLAVHPASKARGAAIASCVGDSLSLEDVVVLDEGFGAMVLQGYFSSSERDGLVSLLESGMTPAAALAERTDPKVRGDDGLGPEYRQIGIVAIDGTSVGYTGSELTNFAGDIQVERDGWSLSIQGNILDGEDVLANLEHGFFEDEERTLKARLANSLLRVVESRRGDSRCSPNSADQFFLVLDEPDRERESAQALLAKSAESGRWLETLVNEGTSGASDSSGCSVFGPGRRSGVSFVFCVALASLVRRRSSSAVRRRSLR